ncbi:MAG: 2,3-bisphosphoglycerate-independent phosphoglycerate mutase [Alphaproteobacteria bacterium]|nr:2,3-bisphosphoglycerate-independent phosphoglycerate mutase [Alphaproteobacteria bacterium]
MTEPEPPHLPRRRPVVLCILDGWGHSETRQDNAIALGETPNFKRWWANEPHALLKTSAGDVGLPEGQMGNSEVGHQNIGAGRVVYQDLPRIDRAIADGSLARNAALDDFVAKLRRSGGRCHLMGLLSPGGVHAHQAHVAALAWLLAGAGVPVAVHAFLDGRDTPPQSAAAHVRDFLAAVAGQTGIRLASLCGRYFAMDRDRRWERVARAYALLVDGEGAVATDADAAIQHSYAQGRTDEFLEPVALAGYRGMADGDGLLFANFRADRAREILTALLDPRFDGFPRQRTVRFAAGLGLASYSTALDAFLPALFPAEPLEATIGEVVAAAGLCQLRIAETEKYAHVTFFLNGGEERVFAGEERILVPSPKVATYDLQPEMSAYEVTARLEQAIRSGRFDFIVVNYANPDMVGHTGNLQAAIQAVGAVDRCLGRLEAAVRAAGGCLFITADHGNCEQMRDPDSGEPQTAHSTNPVPALLLNAGHAVTLADGRLADIAPTLLQLLGLPQPVLMTGRSLLCRGVPALRRAIA